MKRFSALLALALAGVVTLANATPVGSVRVEVLDGFGGNCDQVVGSCLTKVGDEYDQSVVSRDVIALKECGAFEDIRADAESDGEKVAVVFSVRRKLRYQSPMVVVGCDNLSESKIIAETGLRDGYLYGESELAAAAEKVRLLYAKKHYPDAHVAITAAPLPGGNNCTLTVTVEEGLECKRRDYILDGCVDVDQDAIREQFGVYPWWNPIGWFADSPVSEEELARAAATVAECLRNEGYLDATVAQPERVDCEDEPGRYDLVFRVSQGPRYYVGDVRVTGLSHYTETNVLFLAEREAMTTGEFVAGVKALDDAAHRVQVRVGSGEYPLSDTNVEVLMRPRAGDTNVVDVVFAVDEGVPVTIDEVIIRGNDYTKDKVIRREIPLAPGDRMLDDQAERGQRKLENLSYFSRVRYYLEPSGRGRDASGAEYRNLVYELDEKDTGAFMVGVGASTIDSVYLSAEVSQPNFDLFAPGKWFRGGGQKARAYVQWGPRIQTVETSITEPYLFGRLLEFTVEGYRRGRWYDQYDIYRTGAGASLSYPVKFWPTWRPFGRFGVKYDLQFVEFDEVENGTWEYDGKTVSLRQEEEEYGDKWESIFRIFWSRDSRDNFRYANRGARSQLFFDVAAGGDISFWRAGLSHRQYFTTWKRYGHTLMAGIRAETIDAISDDVPIYERMFLGGPRSIRGIKYRNVTKFATRSYGDALPWGGRSLFCMNFEYTIPIFKMLKLAAFTDLGSVGEDTFSLDFSDTFAWTAGIGVRIDLPSFPIRLDFAVPFVEPDEAEKEVFSFMIGYDF